MLSPLAPINLSCMNWISVTPLWFRFCFCGFGVCGVFVCLLVCVLFCCLVFACFCFCFVLVFSTERRTMYRSFPSSFHAASHMKTACLCSN